MVVRHSGYADGNGANEVSRASKRGSHHPSRRKGLRNKTTLAVCKFLLEDVICRYGCAGKIEADRGELDANEAKEFFSRIGV